MGGGDKLTDEHRLLVQELDIHIERFNTFFQTYDLGETSVESVGPLIGEFDVDDVRTRIQKRQEMLLIIFEQALETADLDPQVKDQAIQRGQKLNDTFEQVLDAF